jgi:16S rRNA (uracil1498-N3)-methyltransferase
LGVSEIVPLAAERSEKALVAAAAKRAPRWERILHESAQQSRRLRAPVLRSLAATQAAFAAANSEGLRILLSERATAVRMRAAVFPTFQNGDASGAVPQVFSLAIGPEGGWTDAEFAAATASGFVEATLGGNILRTETAVCAALAGILFALG